MTLCRLQKLTKNKYTFTYVVYLFSHSRFIGSQFTYKLKLNLRLIEYLYSDFYLLSFFFSGLMSSLLKFILYCMLSAFFIKMKSASLLFFSMHSCSPFILCFSFVHSDVIPFVKPFKSSIYRNKYNNHFKMDFDCCVQLDLRRFVLATSIPKFTNS